MAANPRLHNISTVSQINTTQKEAEESKGQAFTFNGMKIIGKGSFGNVYQATIVETGEVVAIKKVLQDHRYKNRELEIMKDVHHPNIVSLHHSFYSAGEREGEIFLNLVMEFVPETLYRIRKHYASMKQEMPILLIKVYIYQLFRSLAHLHGLGICHRDIKPQNLLINSNTYKLLLCDFGSAKRLVPTESNVSYICSRFYRAPELIFGSVHYTYAVDIWSAGCVAAELVLGKPLFSGENGVDQLVEIIKLLGTPTREQIAEMNPSYNQFKFPHVRSTPWGQVFKGENSREVINFLSTVLVYSPIRRQSALEHMLHPFFDELRDQETRLPGGERLHYLFDWTEEERRSISPEILDRLTPDWV